MLRGPSAGFRPIFFSLQYRPLVEQVELGGAEAADVQDHEEGISIYCEKS